jgi:hypothetical protein
VRSAFLLVCPRHLIFLVINSLALHSLRIRRIQFSFFSFGFSLLHSYLFHFYLLLHLLREFSFQGPGAPKYLIYRRTALVTFTRCQGCYGCKVENQVLIRGLQLFGACFFEKELYKNLRVFYFVGFFIYIIWVCRIWNLFFSYGLLYMPFHRKFFLREQIHEDFSLFLWQHVIHIHVFLVLVGFNFSWHSIHVCNAIENIFLGPTSPMTNMHCFYENCDMQIILNVFIFLQSNNM